MLQGKLLEKEKIREKLREKIKERTLEKIIHENQVQVREQNLKAADEDEETLAASLQTNRNEQNELNKAKNANEQGSVQQTFVRGPLALESKAETFMTHIYEFPRNASKSTPTEMDITTQRPVTDTCGQYL